ncbi:hypothetical protein V8C35DRAFT_330199 [Trichoderma chlorosporum]
MGGDSEERLPFKYELCEGEANFRQTLLERIDGIKAAGSFATGNVLDSCPIPGICVDGGQPIATPLSEEAARDLASKSDKALFGNHKETLADETVRKALQISAERISFRNTQWDGFVNKLVQRVAHELGVPPVPNGSNVRAELYKHILYEPGAMFKPHKDTEKHPGMFGTLVICLPSKHTGGTVCLQHGKDSLELSTAETSAYDSYYLAWYADVTHEIKPVQTGYLWVLTYNLIVDYQNARLSASVLDSQIQSLVEALSLWETLQYPPDFLVYPLDHEYEPGNLRLSNLKGLDYQRARCLADSCDQHGEFYLFLAQLDKYLNWPNDNAGKSELICRRYLRHVCSLEGFELSPLKVSINKASLLEDINYERDPSFRAGGDNLNTFHMRIEEIYSDMVLVIVRADSLHTPFCGSGSPLGVIKVMTHLWAIVDGDTNATLQKILVRLCRIILDQGFATGEANDVYLGYVAVTAALFGDWPLFEEARRETLKAWDFVTWSTLGKLINLQGPLTEVDDIFKTLLKCGTFWGIYKGLTSFYEGFCKYNIGRENPAKAEYWKQWYSDRLIETLNMCHTYRGKEDVRAVKEIVSDHEIQYTPEQRKKVDEAVTVFVDRFKEVKEFVNDLNIELLCMLSDPKSGRKEFLCDLFSVISEFAISTFDFDLYYEYTRNLHGNTDGVIREFYKQASTRDEDSASNLLRQFSNKASEAKKDTVLRVLWPLMNELLPTVDTGSPEVQTCFQSLVETYITKTVDEEPSKPEDWARPAEVHRCYMYASACKTCPKLNLFLVDPEAKEKTIALTTTEQEHINLSFGYLETRYGVREGEVRFTKTLEGWEKGHHNWEFVVKATQDKLQKLPKDALKRALGDKYDTLMALDPIRIGRGTAQPPSRPKRKRGEANNTESGIGAAEKRLRTE